jgi:Tol biopolymer transport system component
MYLLRPFCLLFALVAAMLNAPNAMDTIKPRSRLMTLAFDGSGPRLVYETADLIEAPNWSPDGRWLVFNGGGKLFRIAADGAGGPRKIGLGGVAGANNDHVLSPDGKTLYFSARGHIYAVSLEGGQPRRVSNEHPGDAKLVYWLHGVSPDGRTLAHCGDRGGNKDIWTLPAAGGEDRRLTDHAAAEDGPDYSPDGRWIYFNADRSGTNQIWRIPATGGEAEQITRDDRANWFPHPSPDGRWIVYLSYPPGTEGHPPGKRVLLRRMTPDGKDIRDLRALFGGQGTINVPSWSPDSRRFAFVEYVEE